MTAPDASPGDDHQVRTGLCLYCGGYTTLRTPTPDSGHSEPITEPHHDPHTGRGCRAQFVPPVTGDTEVDQFRRSAVTAAIEAETRAVTLRATIAFDLGRGLAMAELVEVVGDIVEAERLWKLWLDVAVTGSFTGPLGAVLRDVLVPTEGMRAHLAFTNFCQRSGSMSFVRAMQNRPEGRVVLSVLLPELADAVAQPEPEG